MTPMQHLNQKLSFGRAPQGLLSPSRRWLTLDPLAHLERMRVAVIKHTFAAKAVFLRRKIQSRIFQINEPIRMYIRDKNLALIFQGLQQPIS
jgi:hypothetical protein